MTDKPGEHRVETHLGIEVAEYDRQIRRYIPHYDEMIGEVLAILHASLPDGGVVVDLGTGTGALACAILDAIPRSRVILVDIDPAMLAVAARRVAHHGDRAIARRSTFQDAFTGEAAACDAVVASLALHHVPVVDHKRQLYSRIYNALRPDGMLLVADATVHETGREHDYIYRGWTASLVNAGFTEDEARELFAKWALEDRYHPLCVELAQLGAAGFPRAECFWRRGPMTVFGGFR